MNPSLSAVLKARELLRDVTPLVTDCGRFCGGACCEGDEETGMLLFPGEETLYENCSFGEVFETEFQLSERPALLFVCDGQCPRDERPLSCRLFPLLPSADETCIRLDPRAAGLCPLYRSGMKGLAPAFVEAVRQACRILAADEECRAWLNALGKELSL